MRTILIMLEKKKDRSLIDLLLRFENVEQISFKTLYKLFGRSNFYYTLKRINRLENVLNKFYNNFKIFERVKDKVSKRKIMISLMRLIKYNVDISHENYGILLLEVS